MSYMPPFRPRDRLMHRIAFVVSPGFQILSLSATTVFEFANLSTGRAIYEVEVLSEAGRCVSTSMGLSVDTRPFEDTSFDTVIFTGGTGILPPTPALIDYVRRSGTRAHRVTSICTGAFVLAEAGLLDERRGTAPWAGGPQAQFALPKDKGDQ